MNKIAIRKIVLICAIAVLAAIYVAQLAVSGRSTVKTFSFDAQPDLIRIVTGAGESSAVELVNKNGSWLVGQASSAVRYPADSAAAEGMVSALKEIKILGTVAGNTSSDADRYGLDENSRITVTAYSGEKLLRTLIVGKNTSTANQCYVQIDSKNAVYLEEKALHSTFAQDVGALRSKTVYQIDSASIMAVKSTAPDGKIFAVARNTAPVVGEENAAAWNLAENTTGISGLLDDSAVTSWVNSLATLTATEWSADDVKLDAQNVQTVELSTTSGTYTVSVQNPGLEEDTKLCSASSTPYAFTVGKYVAQRYTKNLTDLLNK